ncbi:TldD/PmbA family protein [Methanocaldococcus infernus]
MIDKIVKEIEKYDASYIDVRYVIRGKSSSIVLKDGKLEEISSGYSKGIAVRVLYKNGWGFAKSYNLEGYKELIEKAYRMAKISNEYSTKEVRLKEYKAVKDSYKVVGKVDPNSIDISEKIEIVKDCYETLLNEKIKSASVSYTDGFSKGVFINSEGSVIESEKSLFILTMNCVGRENGNLQYSGERIGGFNFEKIYDYKKKATECKERVLRLLKAKPCPKGEFLVVLDPELAGVFIHEAVGHASEADLVLQNDSVFKDKLGEEVGSDYVTIIDNPNIEESFGFYKYDSEGVKGEETVIIEKGVLKSYLHSRETAGRMDMELTGNGRSEGLNKPLVRMSNTYIKPGDWTFEELIEDTKNGIYMVGSRGGQVDTGKGVFQFSAVEAFKIENGEITENYRDAGISGEILSILKKIDAVTKDFKLSVGYCGKNGQSVPVGDGGGYVRTRITIS